MAQVLHGDCLELMKDIPDRSIDMVLTSPPYDKLRSYNGSLEWGDHVWKPVISELFRVVKKGAVVVWVVADATINGSETGTSFRQALYAKEVGFNLHDTMIWEKPTFTATGSLSVRYASVFEYMFVFSKGSPKTFNPIKDRITKGIRKKHGSVRQADGSTKKQSSIGKIYSGQLAQRFNVWKILPELSNLNRFHPAQFSVSLANDHIISWTNEGDVVLDPFAGSGTTAIAALNTGRNYILMEKEAEYIEVIHKRIASHAVQLQLAV